MNVRVYTKRELDIIKGEGCPDVTEEEFLILHNKAAAREETEVVLCLANRYPEVSRRAFSPEFGDSHRDAADMEYLCRFPVVIATGRNTPKRIMNMVSYLVGAADAPLYVKRLRTVPHRQAYNFVTAEPVEDYDGQPLWDQFFMEEERLRRILEKRFIKTLGELVERSAAYFEDYARRDHLCGHHSCEECQRRWMENYKRACQEPIPPQPESASMRFHKKKEPFCTNREDACNFRQKYL